MRRAKLLILQISLIDASTEYANKRIVQLLTFLALSTDRRRRLPRRKVCPNGSAIISGFYSGRILWHTAIGSKTVIRAYVVSGGWMVQPVGDAFSPDRYGLLALPRVEQPM